MDSGNGKFEEIPEHVFDQAEGEYPLNSGAFRVGEQVEVKGSLFRVKSIKPDKLILKLLKRGYGTDLRPQPEE